MTKPQPDSWRRYPFHLVPGDSRFCFPAAEANHADCESDTWFLAGELRGVSGRQFAFLTIFNKNRPAQSMVADFYTFALFDIDAGTYASYTDYDMPPANMAPAASPKMSFADDHLDLAYRGDAGTAAWRTCRDGQGVLRPYTYDVSLVGTDAAGAEMRLDLRVTPSRPPVPLGGAAHHGRIECFGQPHTYSYFHTGLTMSGTLSWGRLRETVTGSAGHVDRQWFPLVANSGGPDGDIRWRAHEWRTINLHNGVDLSIWHQFDRTKRNAPQPFSGVTVSFPDGAAPQFADDVAVTIDSYVRWPESVRTLARPPAAARYLPDRHRLVSEQLGLQLTGEPLVPAPAHGLPLEYMEGPFRYHGTWRGAPITGFGFYERSLALYRDWELIDVLASVAGGSRVETLRALVEAGRRDEAADRLAAEFARDGEQVATIVDDLLTALRD